MSSVISPFSAVKPENIQDFKARYGADNIYHVSMDGAQFIITPPNRTVMDLVGQHGISKNVSASNKALIANCVLAGDMETMERDGGVYGSLLKEINKLVVKKEATVKKL